MIEFFRFTGWLAAASWIVLGLCCCGSATPPISYYTLLGPELMPVTTCRAPQMALLVGPVTVPDTLKHSQIVTGRAGEHYRLSENQRWSGELENDLAQAVGEYFSRRFGTEQIDYYPVRHFAHLLSQVPLDVLAMDGVIGEEARLEVRWTLLDPETGMAKATGRSLCRMRPADGSHEAWVAAQRANIRCLGEEIAAALR
nr:PqiC family protein [uncultured Desulfobulbus sp.]